MSRSHPTSPLLLFDRLCAADTVSAPTQSPEGQDLRESLRLELLRLLNTRNGLSRAQFLACEGSVLHYGLPDLLGLCSQSDADLEAASQLVTHGLCLFEPRLKNVRVQAQPDPADPTRARLTVSASAVAGPVAQRVEFSVILDDPDHRVMHCV